MQMNEKLGKDATLDGYSPEDREAVEAMREEAMDIFAYNQQMIYAKLPIIFQHFDVFQMWCNNWQTNQAIKQSISPNTHPATEQTSDESVFTAMPHHSQLDLINKNLRNETLFRHRCGKEGEDEVEQKKYGQLTGRGNDYIFTRQSAFTDFYWIYYRR